MSILIYDRAEEFRIEVQGLFSDECVEKAAEAWRSALRDKSARHISVDITQMTGYDVPGYMLLREAHTHGARIVANTPSSLRFFGEISGPPRPISALLARRRAQPVISIPTARSAAAGE